MPTEILMPALSPTMEEGTLARWLVKEGDTVKSGDVMAEIETDKATMEFEAVDEGVIGRILVPEGSEGVKVNQPIAVLLGEGEDASAASGAGASGGDDASPASKAAVDAGGNPPPGAPSPSGEIADYSLGPVPERTGNGQWGGRVERIVLVGRQANVRLTGDEFRLAFGLRSTWFAFESTATTGKGSAHGDRASFATRQHDDSLRLHPLSRRLPDRAS